MFRDVSDLKKDAVRVTLALLVVSMLIKLIEPFNNSPSEKDNSIARNMLEQANYWYNMSSQDKSTQSKNQHIAYAVAYLNAARHITSDATLERLTGLDVHTLQTVIEREQKTQSKLLLQQCPKLSVDFPKHTTKRRSWL